MTPSELRKIIECGETSKIQFKQDFTNPKQLATEMVALANAKDGSILFGIQDKLGEIIGLDYQAIQTISTELGNTTMDLVRPAIYVSTEAIEIKKKKILIANIAEGTNKPYKDLNGTIWVKQADDKRKLTDNTEILNLFQDSQKFQPELEAIKGSSYKDIEVAYLNEYFQTVYGKPKESFDKPITQLLQSIGAMTASGEVTNAGMLFFGRQPQMFLKTFMIKAVAFYGDNIGETEYRDSRDIQGTIPWMYREAISFIKANLPHRQKGQSFNSIGKIDVPEIVLEELLQNALVHINLLEPASIRLLIFSNRIEIVNPGSLFGNLTVEEIKLGVSKLRNPLIASFCSKTLVYRGLGSGIIRVLREDIKIDFENNPTTDEFKATIWLTDTKVSKKPTLKEQELQILKYLELNGNSKAKDIASHIELSIPQTKTYLYRLVNKERVVPNGTVKNRTYSLKK